MNPSSVAATGGERGVATARLPWAPTLLWLTWATIALGLWVGASPALAQEAEQSLEALATTLARSRGDDALALGLEVAERFVYAEPTEARRLIRVALERSADNTDLSLQGTLHRWIGNSFVIQQQLDQAAAAYERALALFRAAGDAKGMTSIQLNSGVVARRRGLLAEATRHYREALRANELVGDQKVLYLAHHNLAVIFEQSKLFNEAIEHYDLSRRAGQAIGEATYVGEVNTARVYAYLDKPEQAQRYLALAKAGIPDDAGAYRVGEIHLAEGDILQRTGDAEGAILAYERAATLYDGRDTDERLAWAVCGVAYNRVRLNRLEETAPHVSRCSSLANSLPGNGLQRIKAQEVEARHLLLTGDPTRAAEVAIGNYNAIIEFFTALGEQQVALASTAMQEEFNRQAVLLAQQQATLAELRTQRQSTLLGLSGGALLVVGTLCALLVVSIRQRYRANRELQVTATNLEEAVDQRELLLQELNHRVKNNLQVVASLLGLERRRAQGAGQDDQSMRDIQARVLSMASIHEGILDVGASDLVDMEAYLERLANRLRSLYGPAMSLRVSAGCSPSIELAAAAPVGLIVCELVSNAMKHAYTGVDEGSVTIELAREAERAVLTVSDEGGGLAEDFSLNSTDTLGLSLVQDLARQIDTTLSWHRNHPHGTRWSVPLPAHLLTWSGAA